MHTALVAALIGFAAVAIGVVAGGWAGLVLAGGIVVLGVAGATAWTLAGVGAPPAPRGGRL